MRTGMPMHGIICCTHLRRPLNAGNTAAHVISLVVAKSTSLQSTTAAPVKKSTASMMQLAFISFKVLSPYLFQNLSGGCRHHAVNIALMVCGDALY